MKERPILFSGSMVRALLAGTKSQTRRVVKPQPHILAGELLCWKDDALTDDQMAARCPYGQPGDRLWVREAWMPDPPADGTWNYTAWAGCREGQIAAVPEKFRHPRFCNYAATWPHDSPVRWTPSIHMPRWASRITLEITEVRVERLQDISEADALAEGVSTVRTPEWDGQHFKEWRAEFDRALATGEKPPIGPLPSTAYRALWDEINGPGSWEANPWVWAVSFKRVEAA